MDEAIQALLMILWKPHKERSKDEILALRDGGLKKLKDFTEACEKRIDRAKDEVRTPEEVEEDAIMFAMRVTGGL